MEARIETDEADDWFSKEHMDWSGNGLGQKVVHIVTEAVLTLARFFFEAETDHTSSEYYLPVGLSDK